MPLVIRRLVPDHAARYRALMLAAYAEAGGAFTSTVAERETLPLAWWESRLSNDPEAVERVLGAFVDGDLVGVAGLRRARRLRTRHKATLFGMVVQPAHRGRGIGRALVEAVLGEAASEPGVLVVQLTVTEANAAARRLYEACGFAAFGTEPFAIRLGDGFASKVHLWRGVGPEVGHHRQRPGGAA
ncbi:MAG: GNAT family N-acetyltransferase [Bacteroidota bacterium]